MECLQSRQLLSIQGIRHGLFFPGIERKIEDNFSFKNAPPEVVLDARRRACGLLKISYEALTHVYQDHGTTIWTVDESHRGAGALTGENQVGVGDGLITVKAEVPLSILIADCLPIFYSTRDGGAIGLAHAGWRGTYEDIAFKMVEEMQSQFSTDPSEVQVWIGPGISSRGFTVGEDVWTLFRERWGTYGDCFDPARHAIDLKQLNKFRLECAGVLAENIEVSSECTYSDPRFFSYRRDGKGSGHNMAVIVRD